MQVLDPVCGMAVETTAAVAKAEHAGTVYFFCSADCHRRFISEPEKYLE